MLLSYGVFQKTCRVLLKVHLQSCSLDWPSFSVLQHRPAFASIHAPFRFWVPLSSARTLRFFAQRLSWACSPPQPESIRVAWPEQSLPTLSSSPLRALHFASKLSLPLLFACFREPQVGPTVPPSRTSLFRLPGMLQISLSPRNFRTILACIRQFWRFSGQRGFPVAPS